MIVLHWTSKSECFLRNCIDFAGRNLDKVREGLKMLRKIEKGSARSRKFEKVWKVRQSWIKFEKAREGTDSSMQFEKV